MFDKILIANRGEIACRVIKTARRMGIATVAVYSDADREALHVRMADEAVHIGGAPARESYLLGDRILAAAVATGAQAIHPGYGFLSENAGFARACAEQGVVFIGPPTAAIEAMGSKSAAKRIMEAAGVPLVPGYHGDDQDPAILRAAAEEMGYPVLLKATAGGGGKGMRQVWSGAEFDAALAAARRESLASFGDDRMLVEKYLTRPRHVELQVFCDNAGNGIYLAERDCSVQRRHQKVIEEAPSPAVDADLRARMGAVAVKAVQAIGYEGAGTLEFLLDSRGDFFFMEMNTRLQVEHPVTEAITGLDLVDWQLRVAAGEPLPLAQDQITFSGHAIEVRLCAEDPRHNFMPQSGRLLGWQMPADLRVEHALRPGDEIPPFYDSMIAKLVAHGATRAEAVRKLQRGLRQAVALGVATNQAFLQLSIAHPVFAAGGATTAFIGDHQDALLGPLGAEGDATLRRRVAALGALLLHHSAGTAAQASPLAHRLPTLQRFTLDGVAVQGALVQAGTHSFSSRLNGEDSQLQVMQHADSAGGGWSRVLVDGLAETVLWQRDGATLHLSLAGRAWVVQDLSRAVAARGGEGASDGKLRASMNGRVVAVQVAVGDLVAAGQPMLTLEAMKMEHVHAAPIAGRVAALHVSVGEQVGSHRVVAEVVAEAEAKQG